MKKQREEKLLRWAIRILFVSYTIILFLKIVFSVNLPGVIALGFCLIWVLQWRLFYIRGLFPGKIYTFIYLLITILPLIIAFSQIRDAIS